MIPAARDRLAMVAEVLAMAAGYVVGLVTLCQGLAGRTVFPEDLEWITGEVLGSPLRLTQHAVLNHLSLPLFEDDLGAYFIPGVLLHLAAAMSIHALFVLLCGALRNRLTGARTIRAGGAAAGILFLLGQPAVVIYPSALSYQLVTLAVMLALICTVLYLRTGRIAYWAALVVCYGVALFSHSYAVGLPLMVLALEVAVSRSGAEAPPGRRAGSLLSKDALLRYLVLAVPVVGMAWRMSAAMPRIEAAISTYRTQEMGPWLVLYHARYLTEVLLRFGQDAFGWHSLVQLHRAGPDLYAGDVIALALWSVVGVLGLREIFKRQAPVGVAGMALLLFVGYNALGLVQSYLTSDYFAQWWRFYFNAAGLALLLTYLLVRGALALARLVKAPGWAGAWVVAVGLTATCLATRPAAAVHPMEWTRKTTAYTSGAIPAVPAAGGKSLRGARSRTPGIAAGADLRGADLFQASLSGAALAGARLSGASLLLADLRQARLAGADLTGAFVVHARLTGARLSRAKLASANLEGATLTAAHLRRADLTAAHLAWAVLEDADLTEVEARRVNLRGVRLGRAALRGADLRGAYLEGADLRDADLRGADLRGVRLGGAKLERARLDGARICRDTLPRPPRHRGTPYLEGCPRPE